MPSSADPFAEILNRETAPRKADDRPLDRSPGREEIARPRSRRETREESVTRDNIREAKTAGQRNTRPEDAGSDEPLDGEVSAVKELAAEPKQAEKAAAAGESEIPQSGDEAAETPAVEATDAEEGSNESDRESAPPVQADSPEEPPDSAGAPAPVEPADELVSAAPPETAAVSPVALEAEGGQVVEAQTDGTAGGEAPERGEQPAKPVTGATDAPGDAVDDGDDTQKTPTTAAAGGEAVATQAPAAPKAANVQAADTDVSPAPAQAAPPRPAAPTADQLQSPQAQNGNPAELAANNGSPSFGNQADGQPGQRPQELQPLSAKQQDTKPAQQPADTAKPPVQASDPAAPKVQPTFTPEPVRAVANSFNALSTNPISLHASGTNDRAPVTLKGAMLAVEIVGRMREGMRRFEIRLDPPELGRVEVRLEVDRSGNVKTHMTVDRPETLDLMQREARGLERALQQAGLKTDSGGLEFSLRSHAEQGQPDHQPNRGGREHGVFGDEDVERIEAVIEGYRSAALVRGGVDIRI